MGARRFDAVIFDVDGVLCDSEPFIAAAAAEMLARRYGLRFGPDEFLPFVGSGEDRYLSGAAERHGVAVDLAIDKPLTYEIYLELIPGALQPIAGVREFIAELQAAGMRMAVATGSDRPKLEGNLAAVGISESTFEVVVSGEDITRKKPDPETFLVASDRLGLAPARCLVAEDSPNGVLAARAAGCRVLGISSSRPEQVLSEAGAFVVVQDFTCLPAHLRAEIGLA